MALSNDHPAPGKAAPSSQESENPNFNLNSTITTWLCDFTRVPDLSEPVSHLYHGDEDLYLTGLLRRLKEMAIISGQPTIQHSVYQTSAPMVLEEHQ